METIEAGGHGLRQGLSILSSIEGKCTDPLIRSIQHDEQGSNLKSGGIGAPLDTGTGLNPAHLGVGMGKGIKGDRRVGGFIEETRSRHLGLPEQTVKRRECHHQLLGMKIWADRFDMVGSVTPRNPGVR